VHRGENRAFSRGEVLFTDYGLSGPAIFDVSRAVGSAAGDIVAELDFAADYTKEEIRDDLARRLESMPHLAGNLLLTGMLQTRLGQMVCKQAGISGSNKVGDLTRRDIDEAVKAVKSFVLAGRRTAGFETAQVTAGGIDTADFFAETLQSRLVDGLYACGEVLDIDGDCGGFNLQWAWASGPLAGRLGE
jgi:predicted Rossmann fold flavoprotein